MNRWLWVALAVGVALSIVVAYRIAHLALILGSEDGRWIYGYIYGFNPRSLVFSAIGFAIAAAPLLLSSETVRRREWWLLAYCLLTGTAIQMRLRTLTPYTVGRVFESDGSNGYYGATRQYPASVLLKNFDRLRPTLTIHPRSNMPGKLAFVYGLKRLSTDPSTLALLVVVVSNIGGVVLYWLVRDLTSDPSVALTSFVFYLFVPGKLFFFPILNTVTPVGVIVCLYLWNRAVRRGLLLWSVALGVGLFGLTVFEPLPLVTGLIFAAIAASAFANGEVDVRGLVTHAAAAAASFVAAMLAIRLWLHFDLPTVLRHVTAEAVEFNTIARRPYRIWVWRDLVDFSIATGLVQTLLFAALVLAFLREWRGIGRHWMAAFAVGLAAALAVTDLLGVNRGETVRLWIFFSCLVQVPAAYACVRLRTRVATLVALATSIVVGALGTSMMTFAQP
jgi:hypothetical protein